MANKTYLTHVGARPNAFLFPEADPFPDPNDPTRFIYNLNLTLLPTQIFILPKTLQARVTDSIFKSHAYYTDNEIR